MLKYLHVDNRRAHFNFIHVWIESSDTTYEEYMKSRVVLLPKMRYTLF